MYRLAPQHVRKHFPDFETEYPYSAFLIHSSQQLAEDNTLEAFALTSIS